MKVEAAVDGDFPFATCVTLFRVNTTYETYTSSTAQGGGGSFRRRKPIGEVGCCESRMAERIH